MVGRVWPRHSHRGRPLNSVVRTHANTSYHPGDTRRSRCRNRCGGHLRVCAAVRFCLGAARARASAVDAHTVGELSVRVCFADTGRSTWFCASAIISLTLDRRSVGLCPCLRDHLLHCVGLVCTGVCAYRGEMRTCMRSNNAFERTVRHRGPRLAAARSSWLAAQLGR